MSGVEVVHLTDLGDMQRLVPIEQVDRRCLDVADVLSSVHERKKRNWQKQARIRLRAVAPGTV